MSDAAKPANGKKEWVSPSGVWTILCIIGVTYGLVARPVFQDVDTLKETNKDQAVEIESLQAQVQTLEGNQIRLASSITADSELKFQRIDEVYGLDSALYAKVFNIQLPPHTQYMNVNPELQGYTGTH